jgi:hypothetical protein
MKIIWKDIIGYEGFYKINNLGSIISLKRNGTRNDDMEIKIQRLPNGYCYVCLQKNGMKSNHLVHRLIAIHFVANNENKKTVNHKNGIKDDNRISNLEWSTQSENQIHAYKKGLQKRAFGTERGKACKLNEEKVREIKLMLSQGFTQKDIAVKYSVDQSNISWIKRGLTWAHV